MAGNNDSNEQRFLTEEEKDKFSAEAEKLRAEASLFAAQARGAEATARRDVAFAIQAELSLTQSERAEREVLALDKHNQIYFFGAAVGAVTVRDCIERLALWTRTKPCCDIEIVFSSPGGSVIDGLVLFDYIQGIRRAGHYVTTSTLGWAASMAGILLQAGNNRIMAPESWLLIHEVSLVVGGKIGDIEDEMQWVKRVQERILDIFAKRSKQAAADGTATKPLTREALRRGWKRKDWWISSDEALKYGLVDEIR